MKYLIFIFSLIAVFSVKAQTVEINANLPDTTVYMARYFGQKLYYADTAECVNGKIVFDGSKHRGGLYAILLPNGKPFDFILDNEEVKMSIGDINNVVETIKIDKSINNKIFFEYMQYMNKKRAEGKPHGEVLRGTESTDEEKEKARASLKQINQDVVDFQKDVMKNHPEKFVGVMIGMTVDVELPDHPRDEEGNITDSNYVYHYYVNHFWDNVNLKDYRIVNTPVFHNKLEKYFSQKGVVQIPDTVSVYAKKLIDKTDMTDQSNKVFQYIVHYVTNKYETSPIMGMDKVFCFMAQNYYCPPNNYAYWMPDSSTQKVCERAEKVCRTSLGVASAPLILPDSTEKNWIGTYDIDADYTVLYFWDPNCGHCKKVTPKLQTLYDKKFKERNVEIYAVGKATGDEFDKWKEFIREKELTFINVGITPTVYKEATTDPTRLLTGITTLQSLNYADTYDVYSTPRIFILDENKVILYKQISIGQLEEIIDKLTGHEADEKLFPVEDPENGINPDSDETH